MATSAQQKFYEVNGILDIITDILTYFLPIIELYPMPKDCLYLVLFT